MHITTMLMLERKKEDEKQAKKYFAIIIKSTREKSIFHNFFYLEICMKIRIS